MGPRAAGARDSDADGPRQSTSWAVASAESLTAGRDKALFRRFKENQIRVLGGSKQVAVDVANGKLVFGIADTDDALEEIRGGQPVEIVYPRSGRTEIGHNETGLPFPKSWPPTVE